MSWLPWLTILLVGVGFLDAPLWHGLPLGDDTEIHLYRLVDLDRLIRQGILYSRWQPDLVYGYGSPLFSYYAPLSAYLAELGHLAGLSLRNGMRLVLAVLPLVAAGATFAFLRRRLQAGPALLGALAYASSRYFLHNLYDRGSISDALALALFPVVVLLLDWLMANPGPRRAGLLAVGYAALLLSHDISGPMLLPLLGLLAVWWAREGDAGPAGTGTAVSGLKSRSREGHLSALPYSWTSVQSGVSLVWAGVGLGLGIGLSLFVLGVAVTGAGDTRVPEWMAAPGSFYGNYFVPLGEALAPLATAYPGALLTALPMGLGLLQVTLGFVALPAARWLKPRLRGEVAIFWVGMLACLLLVLPASDLVWRVLRPLQLIQYPWRLLGVAALADSFLIGYLAQAALVRFGSRLAGPAIAGAGLLGLVLAVPYLYPTPGATLLANPSLADLTAFQQRTGALGSTSDSEFLPRGLTELPKGPPFPGADLGATLGQKLDSASVPSGASVRVISDSQFATSLAVASSSGFVARFSVFRFPGWSAQVDGRPIPLGNPGQFQTLTVQIPAGQHQVALVFGETRRQQVFDLVSIAALLGIIGLLVSPSRPFASSPGRAKAGVLAESDPAPNEPGRGVVGARAPSPVPAALVDNPAGAAGTGEGARAPTTPAAQPPSTSPGERPVTGKAGIAGRWGWHSTARLVSPGVLGLFVVVLAVAGLKWTLFDHVPTPIVQPYRNGQPPGMVVSARHRFGSSLDLLGYTVEPAVGQPGQTVALTLYWQTSAPLPVNYSSFVHVLDGSGHLVAQEDNVHVADYPTTWWRVGSYARDVHRFLLPASVAAGSYPVDVGIYDRVAGGQLPVDGQTTDHLVLFPLKVQAIQR